MMLSWPVLVRPLFSKTHILVGMVLMLNVVLIILYFWSRSGATTTVRIEAIGNHFWTYVDGELALERTFRGRPEGGIGFLLPQENRLPGLPSPYGIDSVRVTDAGTGEVIFEDSFDRRRSSLWRDDQGSWRVNDGVFTTGQSLPVTTGSQPWQDYIVEAHLRNVSEATIYVRTSDADNAIAFDFGQFRALGGVGIAKIDDGVEVGRLAGLKLEVSRGETVRSVLAMLLRPYPIALLMVAGAAAVALALRMPVLERLIQMASSRVPARTVIVVLATGTFALLVYLLRAAGGTMPHVPDSVMYVFQAKVFASFHVTGTAPPARESFSIFNPHMLQVVDGRWFTHYPFGHPLVLSLGELVGAIWLVPPMLGSVSVALTYWTGKRIYGTAVGLVAAVLLCSSPFFLMTASNFMSHNTAAFTITAALFFMTLPTKRRLPAMFLAGVLIGLLFNIRPLTAVALMPVVGVFLAHELLRAGPLRLQLVREDLALAGGALVMFGAYLLYNQLTTGSATTSPYALQGTFSEDYVGFGGAHSLGLALQNQQQLLALLLLVANGWPVAVGFALAAMPFLLGTRNRWDYLLGASILAITSSTMLYANAAIMYGPRFWYEIMPFLVLLTARGAQVLAATGSSIGAWTAERFWRTAPAPSPGVTQAVVYGMLAGLAAFSIYSWLLGQREAWGGEGITAFTPAKASQLEGVNFTDRRLVDLADAMELKNALVFVEDCGQWFCYGSVFWRNAPSLDGDVVWAELQESQDDIAVVEQFPNRDLYLASYVATEIAPITVADIEARLRSVEMKDREEAIALHPGTPEDRDLTRRADLDRIGRALAHCANETGGYPSTHGELVALSVVERSSSDCLIQQLLPDIPADPLGDPVRDGYWYRSDGESFLLVGLSESRLGELDGCPENLGEASDSLGRLCVTGP